MKTIGGNRRVYVRPNSSLMRELELQIRKKISSGPMYERQDLIRLRYYHEFEPHGRASETWEDVWLLELPLVQGMVKSKGSWVVWVPGKPIYFYGREFEDVMRNAINFLMEADWEILSQ